MAEDRCPFDHTGGDTPIADEPTIAVTRYGDIEEVLRRNDVFVMGDTKEPSEEFLGGSIVTMDGPTHVARRRLLGRVVDVRQPWGPEGTLFDENFARNLQLLKASSTDRPIRFDLVEFARKIVWQTILPMLGIDDVDTPERVATLQSLANAFIQAAQVEFTRGDPAAISAAGRDALEYVRKHFFRQSYERRLVLVERATHDPDTKLPGDLITTMIRASGGKPDPDLISRETMVFFTASVNNPIHQTVFGLEDLNGWLQQHPEDLARLDDDEFYSRSVQETLRLHRTGNPCLLRRVAADAVLKTGMTFKAGDRVALYIGIANLDEAVFGPDAKCFNPYREPPKAIKPFGLGFGGGLHMCIGRPLLVYEQGSPIRLGMQARMLKSLICAGIRPDPDGARERAPHASDRYSHYGAMLTEPIGAARKPADASGRASH